MQPCMSMVELERNQPKCTSPIREETWCQERRTPVDMATYMLRVDENECAALLRVSTNLTGL